MDFFGEQQASRRNSRWLVLLFLLAVVAIIVTLYLVVVGLSGYSNTHGVREPLLLWQPELFLMVAGGVTTVILLASLFKTLQLASGGGARVAESLGGRLVSRGTAEQLERRLLNVVDEMAIASGIPVPQVYILDDEVAINAFAAGTTTSNAVVAVTRGCLEQLSRDELQGVVGHEFSHIFNGDMRLNIRLMGVLHGILVLALIGRAILRGGSRGHHVRVSSSSGKKGGGGAIVLFALALFVIGYIGVFFGRQIKAAVSRQREFLADAAAVQYTRNPAGIAGALKKIAGIDATHLEHPDAESASHMFFGNGVKSFLALLATHPPVEERIARLDPYFQMAMEQAGLTTTAMTESAATANGFAATGAARLNAETVRASVGTVGQPQLDYAHGLLERLPEGVWKALRDPAAAHALVLALVVARGGMKQAELSAALPEVEPGMILQTLALSALLRDVPAEEWLPLLELALPALEELPAARLVAIPDEVEALINADKRVTLFEFSMATLLRHTLGARKVVSQPRRAGSPAQINRDLGQLLSLMVHAGHTALEVQQSAFAQAVQRLDAKGEIVLLPRDGLSLQAVEAALGRLARLNFRFKGQVIEAATTAIMADGEVKLSELDLLRAIGASLDCPIPPLQLEGGSA